MNRRREEPRETNPASDWNCSAYGCPLPGGMSHSPGPNAKLYCRWHFNSPSDAWGGITFRIRQNIDRVADLYVVHRGAGSRYIQRVPGETGFEYRQRAESEVRKILLGKASVAALQPLEQAA